MEVNFAKIPQLEINFASTARQKRLVVYRIIFAIVISASK
jgi:hypothetical protein